MSQLAIHQRPADDMLSHWAYNSLKRHPLLRRVIDRYQELPAFRTFDFLWEGVETALRESQHDSNAQSIRDDLRKGPPPPSKKSQQEAKGVVAPKGKGKTKDEKKPEAKAKANPKDSKSSDYKGKGKGKANPKAGQPSPPKASNSGGTPPPCIFHARGKCTLANCPFSHDSQSVPANPAPSSMPKASAPVPKAKAAAAMVAFLGGLGPVVGLTSTLDPTSTGFLDFIGDTGAGECLGSPEALRKQGINLPSSYFSDTSYPLKFATGGGSQQGSTTVGCWSDEFQRLSNIYMLPQCPLALSIGQLCNDGFSFMWPSGQLPFLVPPSSHVTYQVEGSTIEAHRIEHNVQVFRVSTEFVPGMPCVSSGGGIPVMNFHQLLPLTAPKNH